MMPILGRYGANFLYTYTVVLGVGVMLALGVTALLARRHNLSRWQDGVLLAGVVAVIAGRYAFVRLNNAYFAENPTEVWQVWLGGLNALGALLGGLLAYWLWAWFSGRPAGKYAGLIAPGLALLFSFAWAACWFEGCGYGAEVLPGIFSAALPDNFGVYAVRYQTQVAGAALSFVIFLFSWWAARRFRLVVVFWATLGGLAIVNGMVALGRGDPSPLVGIWRLDFLAYAVLAVVSGLALVWSLRPAKQAEDKKSIPE
jgi:phosphatidylglycerol---prolipoprotein diacylglyceryl transferase